jgi:arylsulfatase A-like enzyme
VKYTSTCYDAGIPFVDDQIARIDEALDRLGKKSDTIFVFTSDHGEEFMEHGGMGHGTTVYGELIRVPLVMRFPGRLEPGKRITRLTQHVDLGPSLLAMAGVGPVEGFTGIDLLREAAPFAFSEDGPWRTVLAGGFKLVHNRDDGRTRLYALEDELDQKPLKRPEARRALDPLLKRYEDLKAAHEADRAPPAPNGPAWTDEEIERLRTLGYAK